MGSKQLKAVAVRGNDRVVVANADRLDSLRKKFIHEIKEVPGFNQVLREQSTCGLTGALIAGGAAPLKNWQRYGEQSFPGGEKVSEPEGILKYQTRKFACANCPIACGGIVNVNKGQYPLGETHKPEYETIGALYLPSRGTGYVCDPTPGRHTAAPMARIDGGPGEYAPYPEMKIGKFERYEYSGKRPISAKASW